MFIIFSIIDITDITQFLAGTAFADGLAPSSVRAFAGTVMTKFGSYIYIIYI